MYFNERMTVAKLRRIWRRTSAGLGSTCKLWIECGYYGTGIHADWSGNGNNGTVTSATVADHPALPPPLGFDFDWPGVTAAAAAAAAYAAHYQQYYRSQVVG
jgi:hypothetical protein